MHERECVSLCGTIAFIYAAADEDLESVDMLYTYIHLEIR